MITRPSRRGTPAAVGATSRGGGARPRTPSSESTLRTLNKECSEEENHGAIEIINRLGDELEAEGRTPVRLFTNIMLGIPGESREDAFKSIRMMRSIRKAALPSSLGT